MDYYICEFSPDGKHFIPQKKMERVKLEKAWSWLHGIEAKRFRRFFKGGKIRIRNLETNAIIGDN